MFSSKLKLANHNPKLLKRSSLDLVEATTSQNGGRRKYPTQISMKTVSSQLVGLRGGRRCAVAFSSDQSSTRTGILRRYHGWARRSWRHSSVALLALVRQLDDVRDDHDDDAQQERQGGRKVGVLVDECDVVGIEVRGTRRCRSRSVPTGTSASVREQLECADHREDDRQQQRRSHRGNLDRPRDPRSQRRRHPRRLIELAGKDRSAA